MPNTQESRDLDDTSTSVAKSINNFVLSVFILEVVFKALFKLLIGTMVNMQLLVHFGILGVKLPANALLVINKVRPVVSFKLVKELDKLNDIILEFDYKLQAEMVQ